MRKITWSVKGNLKFLLQSFSTTSMYRTGFQSWACSRICGHFQQHLYCDAQKRLFMNFRCNFRHHRSIRRPKFPIKVQNFGDMTTFYDNYCILYSECPQYFYFRFDWPTDLESIPHAPTRTLTIPTKFEVDMTIHCRVIAFLSADTSRDLLTLTFDFLTTNSCSS